MFRIKKLDIFILKQFGLLFVGTFFICQFVLMMQFLWRYIDTLIGKGLTMDVLAQFFWYMGLMLVPQALPLAILLSSLITFGNIGESSELTAIKAAGVSLMQTFRSLIVFTILICLASFYFQNNIGPMSNQKLAQLLISMKQKSPELEIPEGVFYDGIPQCNIYVDRKDKDSGVLHDIMIYRMTDSFEDAAIILADSGMLQSTADKKHLLLNLYSGEWFENMRSQEIAGSASVPYRRQSFTRTQIIIDFDGDFNLTDASALSLNARGKSLEEIRADIDSLSQSYDSIGRTYYNDAKKYYYSLPDLTAKEKGQLSKLEKDKSVNVDTIYSHLRPEQKLNVINHALMKVQQNVSDLEFKAMMTADGDKILRQHQIEAINKFTLALQCLIFFFIGAPLGAIIRKGGLGMPIIVSIAVYIIYYILDNTGYRMARSGIWAVWFGKSMAPVIMSPLAVFITYKANNDSTVFNFDLYRDLLMRLLGMRLKRHVFMKEVIINDPDYHADSVALSQISDEVTQYSQDHNLKSPPNIIKVFFKYQPDNEIERISERLEAIIEDLSNTRDKVILSALNEYPIVSIKAHTRPFEHRWLNIAAAILVPVGAFLYFRMWRFRLRLLYDLRTIKSANSKIIKRLEEI